MIQDGLGNFLVDAKVTIHHYIPALQGTSPNTRASLSLSVYVGAPGISNLLSWKANLKDTSFSQAVDH